MPNVFLAEAFKKSGRFHVPIGTVGGIGTVEDAEEIIASGKADYVIMARSLIADPELIHKGFSGNTEDVVPCVKCMRCHDSCVYGRHLSCAVNPRAGFESNLEHMEKPADKVKKVAVIGGGPAGMNAALEASKRGHEVTLYEKSDSLGGALKFADYVSFKYPLANFKNFLVKQVEKSDITVKLNTEVTPDEVKGYDAVIAAVGATPLVPPIEGIENAKVATSVYGKESELGKSAVVIGGGQIGCETALHLSKNGLKVTVIEMQDNWAPDASTTHRDELVVEFKKAEDDVTILTSAKCSKVTADSVTYVKDGKEETVNADSIILAAGMKPRAAEADAFMGITPEYAIAGDCVRARTVEQAMKESMYAAVNL
jgi:NADPH-dependent 2,4-dienoyl-CoA reductase/sulfur reductase-like enzyme